MHTVSHKPSPAFIRRLRYGLLDACLFLILAPGTTAAAASCDQALPLPLGHSIPGHLLDGGAELYSIEIEDPGFLVVEAHGERSPLPVRFLGRACQDTPSNLPLPAINGRHMHEVGPGTYFVEIAADNGGGGSYRLDAWLADPGRRFMAAVGERADCVPAKEEMDETDEFTSDDASSFPAKEEMDETDEFGGCMATKEEMDETDELVGGDPSTWYEIAGHGLLEIVRVRWRLKTRFHSLCPWPRRPGLLATFTCAPRLRLARRETVTVRPPTSEARWRIGVSLGSAGSLAIETIDDPSATVAVFDAQGHFTGELTGDSATRLEAGHYFIAATGDGRPVRFYTDLD